MSVSEKTALLPVPALRAAVKVIEMDWEQLPGDTALEVARGLLADFGLSADDARPKAQKATALIEETLGPIDEARSSKTKGAVRAAFQQAITTLNAGAGAKPKAGFDEQSFMTEFNDLLAANEKEKALTCLLNALPGISAGGLNRKEKLKHLTFAGRRLQHAGLGKYGIDKLKRKSKVVSDIATQFGVPNKDLFVDFGCGAHEPLGLATYFYGNGFKQAVSNDFLPMSSPEYAALSMYDILSYMSNFPEEFATLESDPEAFRDRIRGFDLHALFNGNFDAGTAGLNGDVEFRSCDIRNSGLAPNSVSYLVSFAVFEHVMENQDVCNYLFDVTQPGGLHHHFVDLGDHRAYRHDGAFNRHSFLTEEKAAPNLNRLRASEHEAAFEAAGFEVLRKKTKRQEIPEATRAAFLPKWAEMSDEDQEAVTVTLTLRKPG